MLTLIRHGHYQSPEHDPPLSDLGRQQAEATGLFLRSESIDAIHFSTMRRAAETAQIIALAFPEVPLIGHETLWEGIPAIPPDHQAWFDAQPDPAFRPDRVAVTQAKLDAAYGEIFQLARDVDRHTLVVCHGNVLRYLVCRALNIDVSAWVNLHPVYHCSMTQIIIAPKLIKEALDAGIILTTLLNYNDVQHLRPNQRTFD
jgi:serine/threonine-protein phosphatase PGAM5